MTIKEPRIKFLPGEHCRERVLTPQEEQLYLAAAAPLLHDIDTGMRPEECHRMRWEYVTWVKGRHGTIRIAHGKRKAARRTLPMTPRVRQVLELRWEAAGRPEEGWVWPAETKAGHINDDSLKGQHRKALRLSRVTPFEVYSIRHTFGARLAPQVDVFTLCRVMGWASRSMGLRYVHPSEDRVLPAASAASGDKTGDSAEISLSSTQVKAISTN